jgi:hypothetical protein
MKFTLKSLINWVFRQILIAFLKNLNCTAATTHRMLISACTVVVKLRSRLASEEAEELLAWRGSPASAKRIMPDLAKTSSSNLTQVCLHKIIRES